MSWMGSSVQVTVAVEEWLAVLMLLCTPLPFLTRFSLHKLLRCTSGASPRLLNSIKQTRCWLISEETSSEGHRQHLLLVQEVLLPVQQVLPYGKTINGGDQLRRLVSRYMCAWSLTSLTFQSTEEGSETAKRTASNPIQISIHRSHGSLIYVNLLPQCSMPQP